MQIIYASAGLWVLLVWIGYGEKRRTKTLLQRIVGLGNLCFGVYLLQQIILKGLYDYTNIPSVFGVLLAAVGGICFGTHRFCYSLVLAGEDQSRKVFKG